MQCHNWGNYFEFGIYFEFPETTALWQCESVILPHSTILLDFFNSKPHFDTKNDKNIQERKNI